MTSYAREYREILLNQIVIGEVNTRRDLEAGSEDTNIEDLKNSIMEKGLLNPIIVRPKLDSYELIAGKRRYLAIKSIGWERIPAFILQNVSDVDAQIISLMENVHRADLHPLDKGRVYQQLYDYFGTLSRVSKETGVSISTVKRYLLLLSLSPLLQELLTTRDGPAGICTLSILAEFFPNHDDQEYVIDQIRGFDHAVQEHIIRMSGGDISKIDELVEKALLGCFDTVICKGIDSCPYIPDEMKVSIKHQLSLITFHQNDVSHLNTFEGVVNKR